MTDRAQGGREADRGRPAAHHHGRQGRPVPADQARHGPGAAQRLLHLLVENGDIDAEFIAEHTEGWDAMPGVPRGLSARPGRRDHRHPEADIRTAAAMIAEAGEWMSCWTMGLNQSTHGTWNTNAICNLHLATGAICRPGSGPMSLTGQPNAMGGREMGYMGPGLPGQRSVLVGRRPGVRRGAVGLAPGHHPHRRRPGHRRDVRDWPTARSRRAGSSAPIPLPPWRIGRP